MELSRTLEDIPDAEYLSVMFNVNAPREDLYISVSEFLNMLRDSEYNGDMSWSFEGCSGQTLMLILDTIKNRIGYNPLDKTIIGIDWMTYDEETYQWGTYLQESMQYASEDSEPESDDPYTLRELKLL